MFGDGTFVAWAKRWFIAGEGGGGGGAPEGGGPFVREENCVIAMSGVRRGTLADWEVVGTPKQHGLADRWVVGGKIGWERGWLVNKVIWFGETGTWWPGSERWLSQTKLARL